MAADGQSDAMLALEGIAKALRDREPLLSKEQAFVRVYEDPAYRDLVEIERQASRDRLSAHDTATRGPEIYHSFGAMSYWHEVTVPLTERDDKRYRRLGALLEGGLSERAEALLEIADANAERPAEKWPIRPIIVKAMTLELVAAFSAQGVPVTGAVLLLLRRFMDVPESFLHDPSEILEGRDGKGQGAESWVRDGAEILDVQHFEKTGTYMSINALSIAVGAARSSVREWVKEWRAPVLDDGEA